MKNILCDYDDQSDDSLSTGSSSSSEIHSPSYSSSDYEKNIPFIHMPHPIKQSVPRYNNSYYPRKENFLYANYGIVKNYYGHSFLDKKEVNHSIKGKRKRASASQLKALQSIFESTAFPSTVLRENLARQLGMTPRTVQIWFQNRRQAVKKVYRCY